MHPIRTEYGRDALNDTFSECVVAKANEADCGAQTPKSKHREEGGGKVVFYYIFLEIPACTERGGIAFRTGVSLFFIYLITLISLYRLLDARFARFCDAILRKTRSFACLSFGRNTRIMQLAFTLVALFDKNFL